MGYYADLEIEREIERCFYQKTSTKKTHVCDCGKMFGKASSLAQHKTAVHDHASTKCPHCDVKPFGTVESMNQHIAMKHNQL